MTARLLSLTAHLLTRRRRRGVRIYRSEVKAHVAAVLSKLPQTFDELARKAPILRLGESFARQALRQMAVETYKSNGRELIVFYSLRPDRRAPTPPAI